MDVRNTEHLAAEYGRNTITPGSNNKLHLDQYQSIDAQIRNLVHRALQDVGYETQSAPAQQQWQVSIWNACEHQFDGEKTQLVCDKETSFPVVIVHPSECTVISDSARSSDLLEPGDRLHSHTLNTTRAQVGNVRISKLERRAICGEQELQLTPKEFELLWLFANEPRRVFTRQELVNRVWGENFDGYEHTVSNHINRLRKKISSADNGQVSIETVWGIGYKISDRPF